METITIVNKGGKVVKTSKHLVSLFKEAKSAYQEKKTEIRAEIHAQKAEKAARKQLEQLQLQPQVEDDKSIASSRRHGHRERERDRGFVDDESVVSSRRSHRTHRTHRTRLEDEETLTSSRRPKTALTANALESLASGCVASSRPTTSHRSHTARNPPSYYTESAISRPNTTISRRHTDFPPDYESQYNEPQRPRVSVAPRSMFDTADHEHPETRQPMPQAIQRAQTSPLPAHADGIDPHLAYGTLPPPLPTNHAPLQQEQELQGLMTRLDTLMLEAKCVQHTASTIMTSLQKNPDAMAAVALTLAEISSLVAKMSPGILTAVKAGSPAVFALLCSPQFLIAGGVAVGVTVVMFGGYKIIKKIQKDIGTRNEARKAAEAEAAVPEEAIPFEAENYEDSIIQEWRRGIADVEASPVEEEFITPKADRLRRERSMAMLREQEGGSAQSSRSDLTESTVRRKPLPRYLDVDDGRTVVTESASSERSGRTRRSSRTERSGRRERSGRSERSDASTIKPEREKDRKEKKEKKPSVLRAMFKGSSTVSTKGKEVSLRA